MSSLSINVTAALLRQGRLLDSFATGVTWLALAVLPLTVLSGICGLSGIGLWVGVILLGLAEKYFALRVAFDAELFAELATKAAADESRWHALDAALQQLNLLPAQPKDKSQLQRCHGALRLLHLQGILCTAQCLLFALGGVILCFSRY